MRPPVSPRIEDPRGSPYRGETERNSSTGPRVYHAGMANRNCAAGEWRHYLVESDGAGFSEPEDALVVRHSRVDESRGSVGWVESARPTRMRPETCACCVARGS